MIRSKSYDQARFLLSYIQSLGVATYLEYFHGEYFVAFDLNGVEFSEEVKAQIAALDSEMTAVVVDGAKMRRRAS